MSTSSYNNYMFFQSMLAIEVWFILLSVMSYFHVYNVTPHYQIRHKSQLRVLSKWAKEK